MNEYLRGARRQRRKAFDELLEQLRQSVGDYAPADDAFVSALARVHDITHLDYQIDVLVDLILSGRSRTPVHNGDMPQRENPGWRGAAHQYETVSTCMINGTILPETIEYATFIVQPLRPGDDISHLVPSDTTDLWVALDLETTGTNTARHRILEIAATTFGQYGQPVSSFLTRVHPFGSLAELEEDAASWDPVVLAMHVKSGLLGKLITDFSSSAATTDQADAALAAWLESYGAGPGRKVRLVGHSVHFDHRFILAHMPKTAALLSHRVVDVSTLRDLLSAWTEQHRPKQISTHRAADDCWDAINELHFWHCAMTEKA